MLYGRIEKTHRALKGTLMASKYSKFGRINTATPVSTQVALKCTNFGSMSKIFSHSDSTPTLFWVLTPSFFVWVGDENLEEEVAASLQSICVCTSIYI